MADIRKHPLSETMKSLQKTWLWRAAKQFAADPVRRMAAKIICGKRIPLSWFSAERNWGDALNPVLVSMISGRPVYQTSAGYCDHYIAIGSVLSIANSRTIVWGSGFMIDGQTVVECPRAIHAVRGPLTRAALLQAGIDCPEVYGDPALLLPRFFDPNVDKKYKVGIVPHFLDKPHPWVQRHQNDPGVLIIDVQGGIWEFVRAIKSCNVILSSSLHGLICADAYGVPNVWIQLSDRVIGGNYKFCDYRLSIGASEPVPIRVSTDLPLDVVAGMAELHELRIDLRKLLLACPFLSDEIQAEIESAKPASCGLPELLVVQEQNKLG